MVDFTIECEPAIDIGGSWTLVVDGICSGQMTVTQSSADISVSGRIGGGICPYSTSGSGTGTLSGNQITFGLASGRWPPGAAATGPAA